MVKITKRNFYQCLFIILYFLMAVIGLSFGNYYKEIAIWTPMGLGLIILLFYGLHLWPLLFLVILGAGVLWGLTLFTALLMALIHTAAILFMFGLILKAGIDLSLQSFRDVIILIAAAFLGAFVKVIIALPVWPHQGIETWLISLFGEFTGVINIVPLFLTWDRNTFKKVNFNIGNVFETVSLIIITGLISLLIAKYIHGMFAIYMCLIWAALRYGMVGTSFIVLLITAVLTAQLNFQSFLRDHLLQVILSIGSTVITGMLLAVAVANHRKIENELKNLNENLEILVTKRTNRLLEEIAERKIIEKTLSESERKYRELFETSMDGIVITDLTGRFIDCNKAFLDLLGYQNLDDLKKYTVLDITPPEYHEMEINQVQEKLLPRGYSDGFIKEYYCKNGERVTVGVRLWLRFNQEKKPIGTWGIVRNITEGRRAFEALEQSELKYRSIIENSQDGIGLFDSEGKIVEWNPGLERITGLSKADVLGQTYWEIRSFLAPKDVSNGETIEKIKDFLPNLLQENQDQLPEIRIQRPDGSERTIHLLTFVIRNNESTKVGGIFRDVTEQKEIEESMRKYAQRLEVLYEIDRDILRAESLKELAEITLIRIRRLVKCRRASIFIFEQSNSNPIILSVDLDGETKWGPGRKLSSNNYRLPDGFNDGKEFLVDDLCENPELPKVYRDMANEGIRSYLSLPLLVQGELIGSINLGADTCGFFNQELIRITRQIANHFAIAAYQTRLHEQLWEKQEQLHQLAKRQVTIQEEERRRISRELHDDAGQELTALKIMLGLISQDLPPGNSQVQSWLEESITLTNKAMEKIRSLAQGLRPPALDAVGLFPALEELCNEFSRRTHISLKLQGDQIPPLPERYKICLYRILQEALTNIAKHAKARQVEVQLIKDGEIIYLSVEDDGVGFNQKGLRGLDHKGMGLVGMQERLEALGGYLQIQTGKEEGTRIIATIPCEEGFHGKSVDCR